MYWRSLILLLIASVVLCEDSTTRIKKYETPCPGAFHGESSTYRTFVDKYANTAGEMMTQCPIDYFKDLEAESDDKRKECVVIVVWVALYLEIGPRVYVERLSLETAL